MAGYEVMRVEGVCVLGRMTMMNEGAVGMQIVWYVAGPGSHEEGGAINKYGSSPERESDSKRSGNAVSERATDQMV